MSAMTSERIPPETARYINVAQDDANVGVQAGNVYGSITVVHSEKTYLVADAEPPERKFQIGRDYLAGGMPREAEKLIGEAVAENYKSPEVAYRWALSILSDRSWDQLDRGHLENLKKAREMVEREKSGSENAFVAAFLVIHDLVMTLLDKERAAPVESQRLEQVIGHYHRLSPKRRSEIRRHLDRILVGAGRDQFYADEAEDAKQQRMSDDRRARAWKFFEAEPVAPEPIPPPPSPGRLAASVKLIAGLLVLGGGLWHAVPLLAQDLISMTIGLTAIATGVGEMIHFGLERRTILDRRAAEELRFTRPLGDDGRTWEPATPWGRTVRSIVVGAFVEHSPQEKEDRARWTEDTKNLRGNFIKELVETYGPREDELQAASLRWLARHHARRIADQWQDGTLFDFRDRLVVRWKTYAGIAIGALVVTAGAIFWGRVLWMRSDLHGFILLVALLVIGVRVACDQGCELISASRACRMAQVASQQRYEEEMRSYSEWRKVLSDKPDDLTMARWLDYDKRYLRAKAMELYHLTNRETIAHLALLDPWPGSEHARVTSGPTRHAAYAIKILLMTGGGVRHAEFYLNVSSGSYFEVERSSFRYEAIASVHATKVGPAGLRDAFQIVLVNAEPISVYLGSCSGVAEDDDEDPNDRFERDLFQRELDASGVLSATQIMEAITADGKEWLERQESRRRRSLLEYGHARINRKESRSR